MTAATQTRHVAVAEGEGSVAIAAPVRGAMIITGDNNTVEMQLTGAGAVLAHVFRWNRPRPRRRRDRRAPPPRFDNHVDRDDELAVLAPAGDAPRVVNVYGPRGIGKTYVLVEAINRLGSSMRDGVVYVDGSGRSAEDLLHAVFDELYECRIQRRDLRIERLLSSRRAVLALEDVELPSDGAQRLVLGAASCRFVVTSRSRVLYDGAAVGVGGLSHEHAVAIAEQELGRALEGRERAAAEAISARLGGHPLHLRQAFGRQRGGSLDELALRLPIPRDAADRLAAMTPRQLLAARTLAVYGHASVGDEHVRALAGDEAFATLRELEAGHDVTCPAPHRHRLDAELADELSRAGLDEETELALGHFTTWAQAHGSEHATLLSEADAMLALARRAYDRGRLSQVVQLVRSIEGAYALGQRWAAWGVLLGLMADAAHRCEHAEAEGWARHQLGTRALGMGRVDQARAGLHESLAIRERIGDRAGAAATRQNLDVATGAAPLPQRLSHVAPGRAAAILSIVLAAMLLTAGTLEDPRPPAVAGTAFTIEIAGDGAVVSAGGSVRCARPVCHVGLSRDRAVRLLARPRPGWRLTRWEGACSAAGPCLLPSAARSRVVARFERTPRAVARQPARTRRAALPVPATPRPAPPAPADLELTVVVIGDGVVSSEPAVIDGCAGQCAAALPRGARIRLTPSAGTRSAFAGWTGPACEDVEADTGACTLEVDSSMTIAARFLSRSAPPVVRIVSPPDGARLLTSYDAARDELVLDQQFVAEASDADGDPLTYRWTDTAGKGGARPFASELSPRRRLVLPDYAMCKGEWHIVSLAASDGESTTTAQVRVLLYSDWAFACPS